MQRSYSRKGKNSRLCYTFYKVLSRNILTCYCKLVVMNLFPAKCFIPVLSRYLSFYPQFGDIIKVGTLYTIMLGVFMDLV